MLNPDWNHVSNKISLNLNRILNNQSLTRKKQEELNSRWENTTFCIVRYQHLHGLYFPHVISVWDNFKYAKSIKRHLNKLYKKLKLNYRFEIVVVPQNKFNNLIFNPLHKGLQK